MCEQCDYGVTQLVRKLCKTAVLKAGRCIPYSMRVNIKIVMITAILSVIDIFICLLLLLLIL